MNIQRKALFLPLILFCNYCVAQTVDRQATFLIQSKKTMQLEIGGVLDGDNTFTYPAFKAFEPLKTVRLTNLDTLNVVAPRLVVNNKKNWYDINSIVNECFGDALDEKERALSLWKFIRDNRIHAYEPEPGDETNDPVKLFGVYGYGMCYNTNYANAFIADKNQGYYQSLSNRTGRHYVSQFTFGGNYQLVDGDLETFYLEDDNKTIASYGTISGDLNLVSRTHHNGKNFSYNLQNDEYLARFLYVPQDVLYNFGYMTSLHKLDVVLRPGESIEYNWAPGARRHSYGQIDNVDPGSTANGKLIYQTNFKNASIDKLVTSYKDVLINQRGRSSISAGRNRAEGNILIKVQSPFVILNSTVSMSYSRTSDDSFRVMFSKDSVTWTNVFTSTIDGTTTDSINLESAIATRDSKATYSYFIKIMMRSGADNIASGVNDLTIVTDFQLSRSFLPAFHVGNNSIDYADPGTSRNLQLDVAWKESSEDSIPDIIPSPVFPANGADINKLKFTFQWPAATDVDDSIVDYEFMLSDRADMKFPLSSSFEIYTSKVGEAALNQFTIPYDGMLNPGDTYYWRVRAKDAFGAWGPWSDTWSFVPHGPLPATSGVVSVKGDSLKIEWKHSDLPGTPPSHYEIHASHEALGFTPDTSTLLFTSSGESGTIAFKGVNAEPFYRIVALDSTEARSGPSKPFSFATEFTTRSKDTLRIDQQMPPQAIMMLSAYHKDYLLGDLRPLYYDNKPLTAQVIDKPKWMTFNTTDNTFSGTPSFSDLWTTNKTVNVKVRLSNDFTGLSYIQTIEIPVFLDDNYAPLMTAAADSSAYVEALYTASVKVTDIDSLKGDQIEGMIFTRSPGWIRASFSKTSGQILISGTPDYKNVGINKVTLRVYDLRRDTTSLTLFINVKDTISLSLVGMTNLRAEAKRPFSTKVSVQTSSRRTQTYTFSLLSGPAWLSIGNLTGVISGTPGSADLGRSDVQVKVTDASGRSSTKTYSISVIPLPEINQLVTTKAKTRVNFSSEVEWSYDGAHDVSIEMISGPSWITLEGSVLSGTPTDDDYGTATVQLRARSGPRRFTDFTTDITIERASLEIQNNPRQYTIGDSVTYKLQFEGSAPWSFTLESNKNSKTYDNIMSSTYHLRLPPLQASYLITGMADADIDGLIVGENVLEVEFAETNLVLASPNPFTDKLNVNYVLHEPSYVSIELKSSTGANVNHILEKSSHAGSHSLTWMPPKLPAGIYLLVMRSLTMSGQEKFSTIKISVVD